MSHLRQQLHSILQGRVCLVGVGNLEQGDDGVGMRLAEAVSKSQVPSPKSEIRSSGDGDADSNSGLEVVLAGTFPERSVGQLARGAFDTVLFLDAVEFGAAPGAVVLLNADEMTARFPQVSTHKLSLGLLARLIEANAHTKVWLLGVQPASLKRGQGLSPAVAATLDCLVRLLAGQPEEVPA